tara:strand:- start:4224 stop:4529 length:306 start_codon:yes stop_codon:yes gene_type:complete
METTNTTSSNIVASYSFASFINAIKQKSGDDTVEVYDFNKNGASDIGTSKGFVTLWLSKKDREFCGKHPADIAGDIMVGKTEEGGWIAYTGGVERTGARAL